MKCSECGVVNPPKAKYCKNCGAKLRKGSSTSEQKAPSGRKTPEREGLPIAATDRIIRKAGGKRVSEDAAKELARLLEKKALEIAGEAIEWANHADRKTVRDSDIEKALRKNSTFRFSKSINKSC